VGRYDRHRGLPGFDEGAQERLGASGALVVGAGGIGSPLLYYLAAAGVGRIGIIDSDVIELSNLNRQILHFTQDIGEVKAASAAYKISQLNPEVKTVMHALRLDDHNASDLILGYDIVLGAVDNPHARQVINRACHKTGTTYIDGSISGYTGMVGFFEPKVGPCRACLLPDESPEKGSPPPVLGATPGVVGSIMAAEAVKFLAAGKKGFPAGRLIYFDLFAGVFETMELARRENCIVCGG
jgi:molybdopterin/thiamine biosynthesis adenylyltransferase